MALIRFCVAAAVLAVVAQAVTPMEKVVKLLEDLKKSTEDEGKSEATTYDKFACFCKSTTTSKSKSIEDGQDKIDVTNADIEKKTATRNKKIKDLQKEQQKLEDTEIKLQETTEQWQKDKAEYENTNADLTKAVNSAKRAHKALSASDKSASFIDLGSKSDVRNCLDIADAMGMIEPSKHDDVTSFLQVDPNDPAYKFHSDKILKIIEDLRQDFADEKDKVNKEWTATDGTYKSEKKKLEGMIKTCKDEIKKLNGEIDKLKAKIAGLKDTLETTTSALEDDSAYLKDLTVRCETKAQAWDQRTSVRHDEVEALTKALDIMKNRAKDLDTAVNKRALLLSKKPAAPAKAAVKAPVKAVKAATPAAKAKVKPFAKAVAKKTPSFLQTGASTRRLMRASMKERALALIHDESIRLKSDMLSDVEQQIAKNPFVKIKQLIQGLIERLLTESKNEATKKGFCDTELGKAYKTRENRLADINGLDADLSELEAHQEALELEIKELGIALKDLKKDLKDATDLRADEKADNEKTIKKAGEGAVAVGEALVILQDFYKSAAKESFVQVAASPVDEDDPGFDASVNKGGQDSAKAILGLLEVIKSDFERTNRKTEAAEKAALAEFVLFDRTSKADIAAKETKEALDKQELASTKSAIKQGMKDLQTATDLLDASLKNVEDLKPTCIDSGMSYKERVQKREEEIAALGKALCMLDADKVEPECQ